MSNDYMSDRDFEMTKRDWRVCNKRYNVMKSDVGRDAVKYMDTTAKSSIKKIFDSYGDYINSQKWN